MTQVPDHSYLSTLLECPRRFFYEYVERWESKQKNLKMLAGSAMHEGLAVMHGCWDVDGAVEAMKVEWDGHQGQGDMEFMNAGHLEVCLKNYYDQWFGVCPWKVVEMIEEPVVEEIDGMMIGGIPDMVVEDDGELVVVDHKTSSSFLGSHLYNRVKFGQQFKIYCLLLSEKLGTPVRRAICNAVYTGKYAASSASKATKFDRYSFEYDDEGLEETKRWIREVIEMRAYFNEWTPDHYPQHGSPNCGWCSYKSLCEVSPPLREPIIRTRFQKREISGKLLSGADE